MNRIVIKLTRKSLFSCRIRRGRHFHRSHRQPHSGETWRKKRGKSRWWPSYSYKVHNGKTRCLVYERNEGSLRLWLGKKWHHLRAVFHLQITFVEVGSSVSTTHHVLFFVTLVLAIGSIVNGTLLQIHFFYGCLKRKSLSYHVSKTDPQVVENLIFASKSTIFTKVQRMYEMVRFVEFKISRTFCSYSI